MVSGCDVVLSIDGMVSGCDIRYCIVIIWYRYLAVVLVLYSDDIVSGCDMALHSDDWYLAMI